MKNGLSENPQYSVKCEKKNIGDVMIEIKNLTVEDSKTGREILRNVNLSVPR